MKNIIEMNEEEFNKLDESKKTEVIQKLWDDVLNELDMAIARTYNKFCEGFLLPEIPIPLPEEPDFDVALWNIATGMQMQAMYDDDYQRFEATVNLFSPADGDACTLIKMLALDVCKKSLLH